MNIDLINDKISLILNDKIQNDKIMYNNKIQITYMRWVQVTPGVTP